MPIYEFRCPEGHLFEVFQRMSDPPPEVCAQCGAAPLQRVFHPVPVHFKGGGFYSTDYGRGSRKKEGDGEKKSSSGDGSSKSDSSSSGSESKSEKKAASAE